MSIFPLSSLENPISLTANKAFRLQYFHFCYTLNLTSSKYLLKAYFTKHESGSKDSKVYLLFKTGVNEKMPVGPGRT